MEEFQEGAFHTKISNRVNIKICIGCIQNEWKNFKKERFIQKEVTEFI